MNPKLNEIIKNLKEPAYIGSYKKEDCRFVLKDIQENLEEDNEIREEKIKKGIHYSEMLPKESNPSEKYLELYFQSLKNSSYQVAKYIAQISEDIILDKGKDVILVSLARAGTPIGVLIKQYLSYKYNIEVPHYSISIIRGKGIDKNALLYIINQHQSTNLQFIDGWTGKGVIGIVLKESIKEINEKWNISISDDLAVVADPSYSAEIYGTREDFFLPSSCLNSIVSGLVSRTVHSKELVGEFDYHACKYYQEKKDMDLSYHFVNAINQHFSDVHVIPKEKEKTLINKGWEEIKKIQEEYSIIDVNKIKPSIGETTRVLLRRVPWKILVKDKNKPELKHILLLAKEKNVPIEEYKNMSYDCIGLIKEV